jgi:hypothetical protein
MRILFGLVATCFVMALTATSNAAMITTLRSTGMDVGGSKVTGVTSLYSVVAPSGSTTLVTALDAPGYPGAWIADTVEAPSGTLSRWIRPDNLLIDPVGTYVFSTTFDMTGLDTATALITGHWATDDTGAKIQLNGFDIATPSSSPNFNTWTAFTIAAAGNNFLNGINTLSFFVTNLPADPNRLNPVGLRVAMSGVATAVPLPATLGLLLAGMPGLGLILRRARRA